MFNTKPILAWNREGVRYHFDSKKQACRSLGISLTTLDKRLEDGHPILLPGLKGIYVGKGWIE